MRLLVFILLLQSTVLLGQDLPRLKVHEQLEDFVVLKTSLLQNTGDPYLYTDSTVLAKRFDSIQLLLNKPLAQLELFQHFSYITTQVKCGHTQCLPSKKLLKAFLTTPSTLPGDVTLINKEIYAARNIGKSPSIPKGSRITHINKLPDYAVLETMRRCVASDGENVTLKDRLLSDLFLLYYYLAFGTPSSF